MDINVHFVTFLLFIMQLLPMSARSTAGSQRIIKKSLASCVGGKWFKVGSFRFWQRVSCAERRNDDPPPGVKRPDDIDMDELMPSMEAGPKRNENYDPSYGYEPYWADGEWVFDKRYDDKNNSKYMCGTRCSQIYTEYGKICARNKDYVYKTFENYCALKNEDCGGSKRWMMLYKGRCFRQLSIYNRHYLHERARKFISSFMGAHTHFQKYVGYCSDKPGGPYAKKKKKK